MSGKLEGVVPEPACLCQYNSEYCPMCNAATKKQVSWWETDGNRRGASHVIIVCDEFDWTDYPKYVYSKEELEEKLKEYRPWENMQRVMEVIALKNASVIRKVKKQVSTGVNATPESTHHMALRSRVKTPDRLTY